MPQNPYDLLLERIVLGDYPPGTSLVEQEIAGELGISRTPVREALLRLKLEGLIKIIPHGGIFVAEASVLMIREVTELRLVLEDYLAHLVLERHTPEWLRKARRWLRRLEPVWKDLSHRDWMLRDAEFHEYLYEAGRNTVLSNHLRILRQQAVLFWGQSTYRPASLGGIIEDYRETLDAVEEGNAERCSQVLRQHCLDHVERIQSYLKPEQHSGLRPGRLQAQPRAKKP